MAQNNPFDDFDVDAYNTKVGVSETIGKGSFDDFDVDAYNANEARKNNSASAASKLAGAKEGDMIAVHGRDGKVSLKKVNAPVDGASVLEDVDDIPDMNKTYPTLTADEWDAGRDSGKLKMNVSPARYRQLQHIAETGSEFFDGDNGSAASVIADTLPFAGREMVNKERGRIARMERYVNGNPDLSEVSKKDVERARATRIMAVGLGGPQFVRPMSPDEQWDEEAQLLGVDKAVTKRGKDEDDDAYHARLQGLVKEQMEKTVARQDWAKKELSYIDKDWKDIVFGEGRQSVGYAGEFAVTSPFGGLVGGAAKNAGRLAKIGHKLLKIGVEAQPVAISHAVSDYEKFRENDYTMRNGNLEIERKGDDPERALFKAIKNNEAEAILEIAGGEAAAPVLRTAGKLFAKSPWTSWITAVGKGYAKIRESTKFGDPFFEENLFEEVPQYFFSDVLGWGKKDSEYKGFYEELANAFGYEKKVDPETGVERYEGSWLRGEGMYTPKGFWNTSLAMMLQMGGQAAVAGGATGLQHIENNRQLANILEGTGMTKEQVANLSYRQREAFRRFHDHFADNPEKLKEALTRFDKHLVGMADELVRQTTFKTEKAIRDYKDESGKPVTPHYFEVQTVNGPDGKPHPKFSQTISFRADGKTVTRNSMTDPQAQVTIVDNGVDEDGNASYEIYDEIHPERSFATSDFTEAQHMANLYALSNQKLRLDNERKAEYARMLLEGDSAKYGGNHEVVGSVRDVLALFTSGMQNNNGSFHGVSDLKQIFQTDEESGELLYPPRLIAGNNSRGFATSDGTRVIILDNIRDAASMREVLSHEGSHALGKENAAERQEMLKRVSPDSELGRLTSQMMERNKQLQKPYSEDYVRDEALSVWMSKRGHNPSAMQRLSHKLFGKVGQLNDADMEVIAANAEREMSNESGEVRFLDEDYADTRTEAVPGTPNQQENQTSETRADEAPAQPAQGEVVAAPDGSEARPMEAEPPRGEALREGVVEPPVSTSEKTSPTATEKPAKTAEPVKEAPQTDASLTTPAQPAEKAATTAPKPTEAQAPVEPAKPVEAASRASDATQTATPAKPVSERNIVEKLTDQAPVQEQPQGVLQGAKDEAGFLRVMHNDGPLVRIPVARMKTPDTQFKEGADPVTGVVEKDRLQGEYFESAENAIALYLTKEEETKPEDERTYEVGTGRHRLDLARRNGIKSVLSRVFKESDGYTRADIRNLDAISNIIDEKGSVKDYVNYFSEAKPSREAAEAGGFLSRPKGRLAFGIYEGATEDTRTSIDWKGSGADGLISVDQAGIIAEAAPKQAGLQRILVKKALAGLRGKKLAVLARSLAEEAKNRKGTPNVGGEMQLDLFTSEEDQNLLALEERRADYRVKKSDEYGRIAGVLRTALSKGGKLDLNAEYAKELGITDPNDKKQLAAARDKAVERANYWENAVALDEADKTAMDAEINATADARAKRLQELKAKREAAKSGKPAPKTEIPAPEPVKEAPRSASAKTEATTPLKPEKPSEAKKSASTAKPAAKTRKPSLKMKDEAGEKELNDALDALFDTPELAPDHNEYRAFDVLLPGDKIVQTHGHTRKQASAYAAKKYPGSRVFEQGGAENAIMASLKERGNGSYIQASRRYPDATRVSGAAFHRAVKAGITHGRTKFEAYTALKQADQPGMVVRLGTRISDLIRGKSERANERGWRYFSDGTVVIPIFDGTPNKAGKAFLDILRINTAFGGYEVIGYAEDEKGNLYAVANGPKVVARAEPLFENRRKFLRDNGFTESTDKRFGGGLWEKGNPHIVVDEEKLRLARTADGGYVALYAEVAGPLEAGVDFDTPELSFDQDEFNRRVAATTKVVDVLQKNGYNTFKDLATVVAERKPEVFGNIKPFLQDIWNAVARARGLQRVDDATAERIFGTIETQTTEVENDRRRIRGEVSEGEPAPGGSGGIGLAEGQPASEGGERGSGVLLAGGRVRGQDSDARVDGQRSGAVSRQPQGLADKGTSEGVQGGNSSRKAAEGNGSVADSVRPEVGERETGRDSSGDGNNPKLRVKKAAKKAADSTKPNPFRRDFVMTKAVEEAILEKSPINRIRQNIAAIKLIRELAQKDFVATPDEQATLAKYVGWGGLSEMFSWDYDRAWSMERDGALKSEVERMARRGKYGVAGYEAYKELRQTLNDEEYDSARASTTTAFYTPIDFVRALHDALRKLGVKGGRFLGPSAGTGNFASAEGEYEKPVNWQFVEKDQVTGMILKALFPNQRVNISGFEETKFPDGFFDFAIDNVPYADVSITDRSLSPHGFKIHDYFFAKTLAKLRPGGVMAFLTSTGTLDKTSPILRQFLTEHGGKIVGAVRLPNGFFAENAGTDVASDLVIVQKVQGRPDNSAFEKGVEYGETSEWVRRKGNVQKPLTYNGYFKDHPEQVIGKMEVASGQFGPTLKYTMPEKDMLDGIVGATERVFDGIDKDALLKSVTVAAPEERAPVYDDEGQRQGNVTMKDGKPYIKSGEMLEPISLPNDRALSKELGKRLRTGKEIVEGLIDLRKAMRGVIDAQMRGIDDEGLKPLLATLNEVYDKFVKKNGTLHDKWVTPFVMLDKADGNRMLALERTVKDENGKSKVVKSDIFSKRVISRGQRASKADTPKDALVISYSETGAINVPRIAELLGVDADEAVAKLKESGDAFENPQTGLLEPSWEYLSGRVRAKLAAARAAVEAGEESYRANVEALEKVQPPMVKLEDTEIKFGATWVDPECMKDFLRDAFGSEHMRISLNKNELTGQWNVEFDRVMNEDPWGETSWGPKEFVSRVLNHGSMEHIVTDPVDKKKYRDEKRTEANKLAADKLHSAFSQFIQSSEKWAEPMYERYNAVMTDNVGIKLPNNILPFRAAGMSEDTLRMLFEDGDTSRPKKGREYQSDVIARGVLGGSSLCLAHCVGAGKTLEMQAIGMLGRRLGMFKKSMYVVPNHMLDQFVNEFTRAFPDANLLKMTAEDVKPANRRAFFAQVANGDWDAIVVKHSTFSQKLGMSKQYQEDFMIQQKKDLMAAIAAMKESGDRISVKQGEKMLARLEDKLKKLGNAEGKDKELVPFEELGVDQLFVDEAHNFKGMPITTRQGRTGGLQTGDSQRAEDMHMKTQYVQSLHGGTRGVVFATGTPLSNAPVVEAYVMLKYLAPNKLAEQGLIHFDDFVDAFGRITTETDFSPDGKTMREKDRISAFVNIPDFMKLFKSVVDIVNSDQLDIPRPKPKYHMIDVDMSDAQRIVMEAVASESGKPAGKEWPSKYMDLTWVAKLACISPRLLGFEDGGNKIIRAVSEVKKVYDETANEKGTQLIFTDRFQVGYQDAAHRVLGDQAGGMAAGSADFNLNEEIRDLLVAAGIPKDEIAIVQDIDNSKGDKDANKEALFAKVRAGEVRVLIGSRPKMGEGTNVQERLAAIHLLHPGWKPSEDEQAIGRIIRNGNMFKEGQIFYYLTKGNENIGSYETKNHQLIGVKSRLIDQVMHSDDSVRSVEMDESAMDRDMLMGLASGNKALMELIDVKKRVHKLELNTESTLSSARRNKDKAEANARMLERRREEFAKEQEGVKEWREKNEGKPFTLSTPDGNTIEKVKDMADYVSAQMVKQLTKDRYDRDAETVLGNFNGVDLILAYDKYGDEKFKLAVPLLGVAREINYSGFIPDFSQAAMTAFKGRIFETVSPDFAKAYENSLADMDRQAKKMSSDADKLQKDYEGMREELIKLRTRQAELERAVTPLVVQAVEDRSIAAYGNWSITKDKIDLGWGVGYTATRDRDGKTVHASTVKELIPLMDAEDFASPKNAATKTPELRNRLKPNGKGETPSVDTLSVGQVDFDTPELNVDDVSSRFDAELDRQIAGTLPQGHVYQLGTPGAILRSTGVPDLPIQLMASRLAMKAADESHPFNIGEVKGLVKALQSPVAVFAYGDKAKAQDIIVEISSNGKNFLVGLSLNPQIDGRVLNVNSIRSVFPKDTAKWLHWIEQGKLLYADKQKIQALIDQQRTNLADVDYLDLDSVDIILNSFANPQVETSGIVLFDTPELSPAEAEYVESGDKTPTEKVMREVYGMTNDDIATAMKAAGMEPPKHVRKPDEVAWKQAEALLSNPSYMAKLSRAVAKFPRNITDYENDALNVLFRQRQAAVNAAQSAVDGLKETTLDAFDAIPKDERDADFTEEQRKTAFDYAEAKAKLAQAKSLMFETGLALTRSSSEAGRRLRSNRGLLDQTDYSYAGISGQIAAALGGADKITPEMDARIREIAGEFASLDDTGRELATVRLKAQAEKIVEQIKNGDKVRRAVERKPGDEAKRVMRNYNDAMAQIEVGAAEVGGTLIGLSDQQYPAWGKWLRAIGEYHCFANPDITEEECINAIIEDISPFITTDANGVRDALTGFGHNFRQSRYDAQRLMNDLRSQSRLKRQLDWMDETNTMPPLTGLVRDEPSDTTRSLQKQVQARKAEVPDAGRDERRLKGVLDSAKTRVKNRIADLKRAIEMGEKIPGRERTVPEDIELRELKKRRDELQKTYDELFKTEHGMTDEQRIKLAERLLGRELELALDDLDRARSGDFSKRPRRTALESPTLDVLRDRLNEVRGQIRELKTAKYEYGMTPEELEAYNARKMANREKAIARLAERIVRGDLRSQTKPQPPMPREMQKRYDEMAEQMKQARQKLAEMRLEAENATAPTFVRKAGDYARFVTTAQRALRATMDFSAVLRQAARITLAHPVMGAKAFGKAWNAAHSEANLVAVNDEIMFDPTIQEAVAKYGLHLREVDATNDRDVEIFHGMERNKLRIFGKEFAITDIPFFGEFMLKSERHYITYLNAASAELYSAIVNDKTRFPAGATAWQKKMVADMINIWNGSAALSKERRQALQKAWVNDIFWAPQLAISRVQAAVGYDVWHPLVAKGVKNADGGYDAVSPEERKTMFKVGAFEHIKSSLAMIALGALLKWIFASDDDWYDFTQADWFEKMMMLASPKIGNTTIDLTGGEQSINRLVHQVAKKEKRSGTGRTVKFGGYGAPTTMSSIQRFMEGKSAPWLSELAALWEGRDYMGEDYTWKKAVMGAVMPLTFDDMKDQLIQNGVGKSLVTMPLSLLGAGGSTYDRKPYENSINRFLESKKEYDTIERDELLGEQDRKALLDNIRATNPLMRDAVREDIAADIAQIRKDEARARKDDREGVEPDADLLSEIETGKAKLIEKIRAARRK